MIPFCSMAHFRITVHASCQAVRKAKSSISPRVVFLRRRTSEISKARQLQNVCPRISVYHFRLRLSLPPHRNPSGSAKMNGRRQLLLDLSLARHKNSARVS
ncbi:hypothetical protein CPT34_31480 [Rhizobium sophoriradicis]|uniref:Uncharacterized protein n=3 Tax=Rhizobium TaxID=379 RepID=Q8KLB4_RHIEC|nr:hypothetical protein RHE_PD00219 [Rhizobium etli CFN 42]ARM91373.1 hypothetical protein RHEC894_PC00346 [Rhizobium sp. CIAT894]ARO26946.1 hypothetical protein TAL182_PC00343 [Rhizobium sp. TAL182]ARQ60805.1 hypothetical protein Kim5_PA00338 [Rhizobium sp. Kim5]PCK77173.1 hypothetical protein CPT34_31480 [Rhizobium sophoriradicis]PDS28376.1 hypothetical protein CO650_26475 [Rhizobium phaseoli]PDS94383.1 hypothetical protein CO659_29360 [Rhizobium sp. S9]PDT06808.1 hypothetical protein CO65